MLLWLLVKYNTKCMLNIDDILTLSYHMRSFDKIHPRLEPKLNKIHLLVLIVEADAWTSVPSYSHSKMKYLVWYLYYNIFYVPLQFPKLIYL